MSVEQACDGFMSLVLWGPGIGGPEVMRSKVGSASPGLQGCLVGSQRAFSRVLSLRSTLEALDGLSEACFSGGRTGPGRATCGQRAAQGGPVTAGAGEIKVSTSELRVAALRRIAAAYGASWAKLTPAWVQPHGQSGRQHAHTIDGEPKSHSQRLYCGAKLEANT